MGNDKKMTPTFTAKKQKGGYKSPNNGNVKLEVDDITSFFTTLNNRIEEIGNNHFHSSDETEDNIKSLNSLLKSKFLADLHRQTGIALNLLNKRKATVLEHIPPSIEADKDYSDQELRILEYEEEKHKRMSYEVKAYEQKLRELDDSLSILKSPVAINSFKSTLDIKALSYRFNRLCKELIKNKYLDKSTDTDNFLKLFTNSPISLITPIIWTGGKNSIHRKNGSGSLTLITFINTLKNKGIITNSNRWQITSAIFRNRKHNNYNADSLRKQANKKNRDEVLFFDKSIDKINK